MVIVTVTVAVTIYSSYETHKINKCILYQRVKSNDKKGKRDDLDPSIPIIFGVCYFPLKGS
jgi:hypothetical protein